MARSLGGCVAVFTVLETATLGIWLALALQGRAVLAFVVLAVGLSIEHITRLALFGRFSGQAAGEKIVVSVIEAAIWAVWEAVFNPRFGLVIATLILAALLIVEHTLTRNVVQRIGLFRRLIDPSTIGPSLIEGAGAGIWRALVPRGQPIVGLAVFAVANFIEHRILTGQEEAPS